MFETELLRTMIENTENSKPQNYTVLPIQTLQSMSTIQNISAADLFCGAGGLTHGLHQSGLNVVCGVDIDPACHYPYEANNKAKFILQAIEELSADAIRPYFIENSVRLLAGCAPCQTFSTYNQKARTTDGRWWLLKHFIRLANSLEPDLITIENVPRLAKQQIFVDLVQELQANGYYTNRQIIVNCADYGVPQNRYRLVLLASRLGPIELISPTAFGHQTKTVRDTIGNLPQIKAGDESDKDSLHRSSSLTPINLSRIRASKPGGSWQDWPDHLISNCHKKVTGKSYRSVYGRMNWDEPAPTLTTQFYGYGSGRFGHPQQDRAISLREGALLQGFPEDYKFLRPEENVSMTTLGRLIGNAVPVKLGKLIGQSVLNHVSKH